MPFFRLAIGAALLGLVLPSPARGVTLNSGSYLSGKDIVITGVQELGDGYIGFFRQDTGAFLNLLFFDEGTDYPWSLLDEFGPDDFAAFSTGKYSAVEFVFDGPPDCDQVSYAQCLVLSDFRSEFKFDVNTAGGPLVHTPSIVASRPPKVLSRTVEIRYEASDEDLPGSGHGLAKNPVSAFYARPQSFDWTAWAEEAPATGTLRWDTSRLPEESGYRLKLVVRGADNDIYQIVFDDLTIDNGAPNFRTDFSAPFTRGEPVIIRLESSEPLAEAPRAQMTQADLPAVPLDLRPTGPRTYETTFRPVTGRDGSAVLAVSGTDKAGNTGSLILGPDTVSVGLEAPPAPELDPLPARVGEASLTAVSGKALNAQEVVLSVNRGARITARPGRDGAFRFENVPLDPDFNRGRNVLSVTALDRGGKISAPAIRNVSVNRPPEIRWPSPLHRVASVNGLVQISWTGVDANGDPLSYRIEASSDEGRTWKELTRNILETTWTWDTFAFPNGPALLRVTASDGFAEGRAESNRMRVQNNLPAIILEASGSVYVSSGESELGGSVRASGEKLEKLEASWNGGRTWAEVRASDGAWDQELERFTIPLGNARTGQLLLRGKTVSGETVLNSQNIRIVRDSGQPDLELEESSLGIWADFPPLRGRAVDAGSGVREIQYSIDSGEWLRLPAGSGKELEFTLRHAGKLADGPHAVRVRAVDFAGNTSRELARSWQSDQSPPRIANFTLRTPANVLLFPNKDGAFETEPGDPLRIKAAVKGAVRVFLRAGDKGYPFREDPSGIWSVTIPADPELPVLSILAEDSLGNRSERSVGSLAQPSQSSSGWWESFRRIFNP